MKAANKTAKPPARWRERVWAFWHLTMQRPKVKATWGTLVIFAAGVAAHALTSALFA